MKTELLSISEKSELFSKAHPMHDCSFVATFEQNTLVLTFDNLQNYFDAPPVTYSFDEYRKLTIKYHNTEFVDVRLKYGKKREIFLWYGGTFERKRTYNVQLFRRLF